MILSIGAFLGFFSVAFGAFVEHGLRGVISPVYLDFIATALRYNLMHAIIISAIGLSLVQSEKMSKNLALKWSGVLLSIGTVLFSFSIYLSVLGDSPKLLVLTPIGGMTIMAGWLSLMVAGFMAVKSR